MGKKEQCLTALGIIGCIIPGCNGKYQAADSMPNVVIIFIDDMAYADISPFGGDIPTPHLDRLAEEGMKFTDFYVSQAVCSASRASLLTGSYANRVSIYGALGPNARHGIHPDELTIAELLKQKDYFTAIYGKWHLGHMPEFLPPNHGFDDFLGIPYSNDMWPLHPDYFMHPEEVARRKRGYPDLPMYENLNIIDSIITPEDQAQFTRQFTERAVQFIKENSKEPFFVYLAHPMVHVPLYASDSFKGKSGMGLFGDVVAEIDWSVGEIMQVLEDMNIEKETLIVFASDNGPWLSYGDHAGSALPLREGKGTSWDGGVRVPCIMRWPGKIPANTLCDEPVMTIDILPTLAYLTGGELPDHAIDGKNIWPLMAGEPGAKSPHEALYIYYGRQLQAIRAGDWKLVFPHRYRTLSGRQGGRGGIPVPYDHVESGLELYNLNADISEREDVSLQFPGILERLVNLGDSMRVVLGDVGIEGRENRPVGKVEEQ